MSCIDKQLYANGRKAMTDAINRFNEKQEIVDHILDSFQIRMFWKDMDSRFIDCNQAFADDAGFSSPAEVIGKTEFDMPWAKEEAAFHLESDRSIMKNGEPVLTFAQALTRSGNRKSWILTSKIPTRDNSGQLTGILVLYQDMTFIKDLDKERYHANRAYQLLRNANKVIISAIDESSLFEQICKSIVNHGYKMAWIGQLESDEAKTIKPLKSAGFDHDYLDSIKIYWSDDALGHGPTGTAAREGRTVVNQNFLTNPAVLPWRESAKENGFQSSIALPLKTDSGSVFAVLTIYAVEHDAFDEDEAEKLEELAEILSYGHKSILEQEKRFDVMEKSVAALAATVESRDPYTAGHQTRVAKLALAIAQDMGLDSESCTGIKLAALIHDIGKMQIPIEILTKPIKLSKLEMDMIKIHPEVGYGILKDIPFPWPVAEIVHQHHERYNGSGYPKGLHGNEIVIGARIVSVADVIESISSYRPYRPALGLEMALNEIETQRGTLYDPIVVDSCLRLFKENRYTL
jgi:putative nucleotidyltransferase with HDIG domain/PAS domain S-box-containing protein